MDRAQAAEYISRINQVTDYIDRHLTDTLTLAELSDVAGFSRYHFHRIFAAMTGETLFGFIQRLRLERAAAQLCTAHVGKTVTQIAQDLGFSSSAAFSRAFRKYFGMSPTAFRKSNQCKTDRNLSKLLRNSGKALPGTGIYNEDTPTGNLNRWRQIMKTQVKIEKFEKTRVAYIRYVGPYAGDAQLFENLYARLGAWAGPRGVDMSTSFVIYHDDPNITEEQKLRLSVCVPVGDDAQVSGEICEMTLQGGDYAVGSFMLGSDEYGDAWKYMCGEWLPASGYKPADAPPFERYGKGPADENGRMKVDICIPVEVM